MAARRYQYHPDADISASQHTLKTASRLLPRPDLSFCSSLWPTTASAQALPEPQWLNCDVRSFNMSVLGKFGVIMTDPPWEIHQARAEFWRACSARALAASTCSLIALIHERARPIVAIPHVAIRRRNADSVQPLPRSECQGGLALCVAPCSVPADTHARV